MLNKTILILIILVFGSITLFGFWGIGSADHHDSSKCPMSLVNVSDCPLESGLNLALHHVSGLQYLKLTTINSNLFFTFLIFFSIVGVFLFTLRSNHDDLDTITCFQFLERIQNSLVKYRNSFLYWLALHNKHSNGNINLVHIRIA